MMLDVSGRFWDPNCSSAEPLAALHQLVVGTAHAQIWQFLSHTEELPYLRWLNRQKKQ